MAQNTIKATLSIAGMTCASCERRIERALRKVNGVQSVNVSYAKGMATLCYDGDAVGPEALEKTIAALGYRVVSRGDKGENKTALLQAAGILVALLGLFLLLRHTGALNLLNVFPTAKEGMGYGMLFVIGLFTSLHCVAMCGGINLSQCASGQAARESGRWKTTRISILYNLGRVISYTVIGGMVGLIGTAIRFSGAARGVVQLVAGVFMVVMGLNMLGIFPWLRRFVPRMPRVFAARLSGFPKSNGPFFVGLMNGLMPCGPLQAMQLYALSTGSPLKGALSMLLFSLGTVPLMFGLGVLSSLLTQKFTRRMMVVSAALVILLGVSMFQSGMGLSGIGGVSVSANQAAQAVAAQAPPAEVVPAEAGSQRVTSQVAPGSYEPITVKAGIPVEWTLHAEKQDLNGCNNQIIIPMLNLTKQLQPGDNVIEFTPEQSGVIPFSCWMGMIRSGITVTE